MSDTRRIHSDETAQIDELRRRIEQLQQTAASLEQENAQLRAAAEHQIPGASHASEQKFRAIFEQAPDSFVLVDGETLKIVEFNERAHHTLGYTPEEFRRLNIADVDVLESHDDVVAHIRKVEEQGSETFETKHRTKDGRIIDVLINTCALTINGKKHFASAWTDITDRKETIAALRESEQRFRTLIENLPGGVFAHDLDGRFLFVNQAACRNTGYTREELLKMSVAHIDPESASREDRVRLWHTLKPGKSVTIQATHTCKDGSTYPAEIHLNGITLDGQPVILPIAFDITARQQAQQALREALEREVEIVKAARVGLWDWDLRTDKVRYSAEWKRQIGYEDHEIGDSLDEWSSRVHPDDLEPTMEEVRCAIAEARQNHEVEFRFRHKDGAYRWILTRGSIVTDDDDQPVRMRGSHLDITARKDDERRREELIKQLEEAQRIAHVGSWDWNLQTNHATWSDELFRIFGRNPKDGVPPIDDYLETVHPDDRQKFRQAISDSLKTGIYQVEYRIHRCQDNAQRTVSARGEVQYDDDGNPLRHVGTAHDITDRKHAEEQRAQLEAQLRHAQKLEAIGQLAGGVAHDFNNILTAILGNVELSMDVTNDELGPQHPIALAMREIEKSAQRAATLTRQLLTFSRRDITKPEPVNLNRILADLDKMLRRLITENITLESRTDPNLPLIMADPGQIEQVVVNLVINAVHAMPDGGRITLETQNLIIAPGQNPEHPDLCPGAHVVLSVSDTGLGIDDQMKERIFEPFFTTKAPGKGTGLGLATVHGIVKRTRGHIAVHSQAQKGTTFRVYLPAIHQNQDTNLQQSTPDTNLDTTPSGHETILLCEDDPAVRQFTTQLLRNAGYRVLPAASGSDGLHAARNHPTPIDLLITDVVMPDINGRALADQLRNEFPDLPTLFVSGYAADVIAQHGVLEPGRQFLEKPFNRQTLLNKTRAMLEDARAREKSRGNR